MIHLCWLCDLPMPEYDGHPALDSGLMRAAHVRCYESMEFTRAVVDALPKPENMGDGWRNPQG